MDEGIAFHDPLSWGLGRKADRDRKIGESRSGLRGLGAEAFVARTSTNCNLTLRVHTRRKKLTGFHDNPSDKKCTAADKFSYQKF